VEKVNYTLHPNFSMLFLLKL